MFTQNQATTEFQITSTGIKLCNGAEWANTPFRCRKTVQSYHICSTDHETMVSYCLATQTVNVITITNMKHQLIQIRTVQSQIHSRFPTQPRSEPHKVCQIHR
jgi:hypothetical protein